MLNVSAASLTGCSLVRVNNDSSGWKSSHQHRGVFMLHHTVPARSVHTAGNLVTRSSSSGCWRTSGGYKLERKPVSYHRTGENRKRKQLPPRSALYPPVPPHPPTDFRRTFGHFHSEGFALVPYTDSPRPSPTETAQRRCLQSSAGFAASKQREQQTLKQHR